MDLQPGDIVDRYVITAFVGRGGMAAVWKAQHRHLGTFHAIKVLLIRRNSLRERLLLEGRIQAAIRHPNVVGVTDVIEVQGAPALVLEWIEGFPLDRVLSRFRLDAAQIDELMGGVFDGLIEVERRGLIHRDLKPGNIMLALHEDRLVPKVVDFGIAKVLDDTDSPRTQVDASMGTPGYMALEQFRDARTADGRADVFSLGAVLYELVTGEKAFVGQNIVDVILQITSQRYKPLRYAAPHLPLNRVAVIEVALRPDPKDRQPTIFAMREAWFDGRAPTKGDWSAIVAVAAELMAPVDEAPSSEEPDHGPAPERPQTPNLTLAPPSHHTQPFEAPGTPREAAPPRTPVPLAHRNRWVLGGALVALAAAAALLLVISAPVALILAKRPGLAAHEPAPIAAPEPEPIAAPEPEPEPIAAPEPEPIADGAAPSKPAPVADIASQPKTARAPGPTPQAPKPPVPIRGLVRERQGPVLACLEPLAASAEGFSADLWLHWTVNADGTTSDVRVGETTVDDATAKACVVGAVSAWTFPAGLLSGPFSYQISVAYE